MLGLFDPSPGRSRTKCRLSRPRPARSNRGLVEDTKCPRYPLAGQLQFGTSCQPERNREAKIHLCQPISWFVRATVLAAILPVMAKNFRNYSAYTFAGLWGLVYDRAAYQALTGHFKHRGSRCGSAETDGRSEDAITRTTAPCHRAALERAIHQ